MVKKQFLFCFRHLHRGPDTLVRLVTKGCYEHEAIFIRVDVSCKEDVGRG